MKHSIATSRFKRLAPFLFFVIFLCSITIVWLAIEVVKENRIWRYNRQFDDLRSKIDPTTMLRDCREMLSQKASRYKIASGDFRPQYLPSYIASLNPTLVEYGSQPDNVLIGFDNEYAIVVYPDLPSRPFGFDEIPTISQVGPGVWIYRMGSR